VRPQYQVPVPGNIGDSLSIRNVKILVIDTGYFTLVIELGRIILWLEFLIIGSSCVDFRVVIVIGTSGN
ncbi:MAG: hypothetical protein EA415_01720, partial [Sphaerobacteraceae bacterium]